MSSILHLSICSPSPPHKRDIKGKRYWHTGCFNQSSPHFIQRSSLVDFSSFFLYPLNMKTRNFPLWIHLGTGPIKDEPQPVIWVQLQSLPIEVKTKNKKPPTNPHQKINNPKRNTQEGTGGILPEWDRRYSGARPGHELSTKGHSKG